MIGTIVNTCAIIAGTIAGTILNRGIKERYKTALYNALGLASLMIGLNAAISNMPKSKFPVLFILSLAIGSVQPGRRAVDRHTAILHRTAVDARPGNKRTQRRQHVPVHQRHARFRIFNHICVDLWHWHDSRRPGAFLLARTVLPCSRSIKLGGKRGAHGRTADCRRTDDNRQRAVAAQH